MTFRDELIVAAVAALIGAVATGVAVVWAAKLGVRAYTQQKLLERRTAWAERLLPRLFNLGKQFHSAIGRPVESESARGEFRKVYDESVLGILFVDPSWKDGFDEWMEKAGPLVPGRAWGLVVTAEEAEEVRNCCVGLMAALAVDLRESYQVRSETWKDRASRLLVWGGGTNDEGDGT